MIFPGMDPYLEAADLWPAVHNRFMVYLCDVLQPQLGPDYFAEVEERVIALANHRLSWFTPDAAVIADKTRSPNRRTRPRSRIKPDPPVTVVLPNGHETARREKQLFVEIRKADARQRVVTVIELLSPSNKYAGPGRNKFLRKQLQVTQSATNLVEIDLLRSGPHILAVPESLIAQLPVKPDYLACVSRAPHGGRFELYPNSIRQRLPKVGIPLARGDADVAVDLQNVLATLYERGAYESRIDYTRPCDPPLSPADQEWAAELLRSRLTA